MASPSPAALARQLLARWAVDPVAFSQEALGVTPWDRQADILRAVAQHPRVAVRSGHKVGKSRSAAILAHWWVATRPGAWVVMTSSSGRQVKSILWAEFRKLFSSAPFVLGPEPALEPNTGYELADGRKVQGFSTDKPERMAGISGANVLFILDEASGIPEGLFEAIEGNRAGGARMVMFSNPTQTVGTFYDAFHSKRAFWKCIGLSSEDSPNVRAGHVVISGLATAEWIEEKKQEWGEESPIFQVRVRGNFPSQGANVVISLALVDAGQKRWLEDDADEADEAPELDVKGDGSELDGDFGDDEDVAPRVPLEGGPLEFGVDPARYGDDESVLAPKRGKKILPLRAYSGLDGVQLAGRVREAIEELRRHGDPLPRVKIDVIGIGASCADQLRYARDENDQPVCIVVEVNSSESAISEKYHRLRDQLWFGIPDFLREGGALPPDDKLARDLVAPKYGFDAQGRYQVEPKSETKKVLGHSPDRGDAVGLAIFQGGEVRVVEMPPVPPVDAYRFNSERRGFG